MSALIDAALIVHMIHINLNTILSQSIHIRPHRAQSCYQADPAPGNSVYIIVKYY